MRTCALCGRREECTPERDFYTTPDDPREICTDCFKDTVLYDLPLVTLNLSTTRPTQGETRS